MRWRFCEQLLRFVIDAVLLVLINFVRNLSSGDAAVAQESVTQTRTDSHIFTGQLRNDITSTGQRFLHRSYAFCLVDVLCRFTLQINRALLPQQLRQRTQALLLSHRSASLALGTIGKVQILQHTHRLGLLNLLAQLRCQLALLADRIQNGSPTLIQLQPFGIQIFNIPNLHLVQRTCRFLTIAGNERNSGTRIQEVQGVLHLLLREIQCLRNP